MALFIVSTPIGNLADITFRAVSTLKEADYILTEDTRVSRKLLSHYDINVPLLAYHDFNKEKVTPSLVQKLKDGKNLALITDAGTPGIADPAYNLVKAAIEENIKIVPVPGASALLTALVGSGMPTDRFVFENFLPHKSSQRIRIFEKLRDEPRTVIFYETPHRIVKVLSEIKEVLGNIKVVIARELTKVFEEYLRGDPDSLLEHFEKHPPRGEMVIMLNTRFRTESEEDH
ncbi:MAG TPA: 16S rRNA (cytidine(1402)-2'-O)-methyltransferase [Chitinispirillaceae bacterium]|jgi:16S rRNA (cytidine1402-2'-O)-methyltransferase|nr:16S rRNA (cytidine(1402)-2'-O)-methyltransferase [Chitinispirillaceae bacterium]